MSPALAGIFFTTEPPGKLPNTIGTNRDLVTKKDFVRCHGGKEGGLDLILMVEEEKLIEHQGWRNLYVTIYRDIEEMKVKWDYKVEAIIQ